MRCLVLWVIMLSSSLSVYLLRQTNSIGADDDAGSAYRNLSGPKKELKVSEGKRASRCDDGVTGWGPRPGFPGGVRLSSLVEQTRIYNCWLPRTLRAYAICRGQIFRDHVRALIAKRRFSAMRDKKGLTLQVGGLLEAGQPAGLPADSLTDYTFVPAS